MEMDYEEMESELESAGIDPFEFSLMDEDERRHLTVSIRADRETPMGIINDVKQALRRAGALNINYSATEKRNNSKAIVGEK